MAAKAKAYITQRVGGSWDQANVELQALCAEIGGDKPGWSGSVGKAVNDVMACFDGGNIAEQMNHVGAFFVQILGKDLIETDVADLKKWLTDAKLNVKAILQRRKELEARQKATGRAPGVWDIAPVVSGSPAEDQWHARADRADVAGVPRSDAAGRSEVARSDRTLPQTGAGMSPREIALAQQAQPGWDPDKDRLFWEEGAKVWMLNERDKWVQWQRKMSLPLGAGPSGSTNQLMQAAKALNVSAYPARSACIAYLLPSHHHSLVEILAAAAPFGCTYTGGQKMYRQISPFTEAELRSCGKDNKFPDEVSGDDNAKSGPVKLVVSGDGAAH
jgi:hypothetical protein